MLVLLDTCVYLRLAKRIRPFLGVQFGHKSYILAILSIVEKEVLRSQRLKFQNPWFEDDVFGEERDSHAIRMTQLEKQSVQHAKSVFDGYVQQNLDDFMVEGRSPPGRADRELLAIAYVRQAIVVTDDLGIHLLASEFKLPIWHGYELLSKLLAAKIVDSELIREIYSALEANLDITSTWEQAKHTTFKKVFGKPKT